ncbi:phosphopantetheine-binding protein [Streptomyces sp. C10-9-1]|uniref:phosphopantetheine-binding protein n=1 Tax=Streptomyces sp. C10-9-1 TaxID=1859285 RepID=UPI0021126F17|nr:phosphopantetheine-binding protein [Streptomyces sp. C10-9-1]MCQ6552231.1 phosphopantetheine-binding protein [Streptomyces sp. C10-9-1]
MSEHTTEPTAEPTALRPSGPEAEVFEAVRRSILEVVPEVPADEITPEASMVDLGCNSVDRADVVTLVLEDLDLSVPVAEFQGLPTIGALVATLSRHR